MKLTDNCYPTGLVKNSTKKFTFLRNFRKCHDFQHTHWDALIHTFDALATSSAHRAYNENKLASELYDHFYQLKKDNQIHDNEWLPKFIDRYRLQMGYTPVCFISPLLMSRVNKVTYELEIKPTNSGRNF